MKTTHVLLFISCNLLIQYTTARSKYNEDGEDNPYEFGFTIDGQQHRHEKKDVNGIIQGEFGFITADGVYHVTVYATDENGNFKILSMRNVRVSGPLDQPNAQLPDTSQFGKDVPKPALPRPNPLSIDGPAPPVQTFTQRPNGFTTQATIKPACAGCGYVTQKSPQDKNNNNKLQFQTQAFVNPKPGTVVIGSPNANQNGNNGFNGNNNFPPSISGSKFPSSNQDRFQGLNNAGVNSGNTFGNNQETDGFNGNPLHKTNTNLQGTQPITTQVVQNTPNRVSNSTLHGKIPSLPADNPQVVHDFQNSQSKPVDPDDYQVKLLLANKAIAADTIQNIPVHSTGQSHHDTHKGPLPSIGQIHHDTIQETLSPTIGQIHDDTIQKTSSPSTGQLHYNTNKNILSPSIEQTHYDTTLKTSSPTPNTGPHFTAQIHQNAAQPSIVPTHHDTLTSTLQLHHGDVNPVNLQANQYKDEKPFINLPLDTYQNAPPIISSGGNNKNSPIETSKDSLVNQQKGFHNVPNKHEHIADSIHNNQNLFSTNNNFDNLNFRENSANINPPNTQGLKHGKISEQTFAAYNRNQERNNQQNVDNFTPKSIHTDQFNPTKTNSGNQYHQENLAKTDGVNQYQQANTDAGNGNQFHPASVSHYNLGNANGDNANQFDPESVNHQNTNRQQMIQSDNGNNNVAFNTRNGFDKLYQPTEIPLVHRSGDEPQTYNDSPVQLMNHENFQTNFDTIASRPDQITTSYDAHSFDNTKPIISMPNLPSNQADYSLGFGNSQPAMSRPGQFRNTLTIDDSSVYNPNQSTGNLEIGTSNNYNPNNYDTQPILNGGDDKSQTSGFIAQIATANKLPVNTGTVGKTDNSNYNNPPAITSKPNPLINANKDLQTITSRTNADVNNFQTLTSKSDGNINNFQAITSKPDALENPHQATTLQPNTFETGLRPITSPNLSNPTNSNNHQTIVSNAFNNDNALKSDLQTLTSRSNLANTQATATNSPITNKSFSSGNIPSKYPSAGRNPADYVNPLSLPSSVTDRPPKGITVGNGVISVPNNPPIPIQDKYPNMVDGLPAGIDKDDITGILYKFNYTVGFHGHYEKGYKSGAKVGGYFVTDRDGVSRIVTYVADENGYRPKVKFIRLDLNSDLVPKEGTEKTFGLKNFEFVWYPIN